MPTSRHETLLINARPVLATLAVVAAVLVLVAVVLYLFYKSYPPPRPAPERVLPRPASEVPFDRMQRSDRRYLTSYGWVARDKHIAHIPIDQAIDLVVQRYAPESAPPLSGKITQKKHSGGG